MNMLFILGGERVGREGGYSRVKGTASLGQICKHESTIKSREGLSCNVLSYI
jgi:hypothetical protein